MNKVTKIRTGITGSFFDLFKPSNLITTTQEKQQKIKYIMVSCKNKEYKTNHEFLNMRELEAPGLFLLAEGIKNLENKRFKGIALDIMNDIAKDQIGMALMNIEERPPKSFAYKKEDKFRFQNLLTTLISKNPEIDKIIKTAKDKKLANTRYERISDVKKAHRYYEDEAIKEKKMVKSAKELINKDENTSKVKPITKKVEIKSSKKYN
jgi:hypothetical protein